MKKIIFLVVLMSLASCTVPSSTPTESPVSRPSVPAYPTSQAETPATRFCTAQSGTISIEKSGSLEQAYCTTRDGQKIDAWKYMNDETIMAHTGTESMSGMSH